MFIGKGRDDLDENILASSESICRRITNQYSRSVRSLAEKIKQS